MTGGNLMIKIINDVNLANVITHDGEFHADEVLAIVILNHVFGFVNLYRCSTVPPNVNEETIIVDIGNGKFDHHQKFGNGTRKNGVPYASAGLIWKEYGHKLIGDIATQHYIWYQVDKYLIQGIDAIDNGAMPPSNYPAKPMSISMIIKSFNPDWDDTTSYNEAFLKAASIMEIFFSNTLKHSYSKAKAITLIEEAINKTNGPIMVLEKFIPWKDALLSSENPKAKNIKFIVFPSERGGYNVRAVPLESNGHQFRTPFPEHWCGLNDKQLQKITGVNDAIFCHAKGFLAGAKTVDGAIKMAQIALKTANK